MSTLIEPRWASVSVSEGKQSKQSHRMHAGEGERVVLDALDKCAKNSSKLRPLSSPRVLRSSAL